MSSLNHGTYPSAMDRKMEFRAEGRSRHFPASQQQSQKPQVSEITATIIKKSPVPFNKRIQLLELT
jgi:hypothetical protein